MANFRPLKNYMFYCLDQFIARYNLLPPFLDVGCGIGDLSRYLARKGWHGKTIDSSALSIERAKYNLKSFAQVEVEKASLFCRDTPWRVPTFKTIFLWDVLEHMPDDERALEKITSLLLTNSHLLISVPSNPNEWRWDDDFYGHFRRYTTEEIRTKLIKARMEPIVFEDFTYPFFWITRRAYTNLITRPIHPDKDHQTKISSTVNAWDIPVISCFLNSLSFLWMPVYKIQFSYFRNKVSHGHEMFALARKI